jgi:hypothetical protein
MVSAKAEVRAWFARRYEERAGVREASPLCIPRQRARNQDASGWPAVIGPTGLVGLIHETSPRGGRLADAPLPVRPVVDSHMSKCLDGFVLGHTEPVVIVCGRPISVLCLLPGLPRTVLNKRRLIALGTMMVKAF